MKFEGIIFDFGDTLATLIPTTKEEIVRNFLIAKGINISFENIKSDYWRVDNCHM